MRLWSLHPSCLDRSGLIACWREGLLALSVLKRIAKGEKKIGYCNHSQLIRFKQQDNPVQSVSDYLHCIVDVAEQRHYNYQREKLLPWNGNIKMTVTEQQFYFELRHLKQKLRVRSPKFLEQLRATIIIPHPMFTLVSGAIETWEKV